MEQIELLLEAFHAMAKLGWQPIYGLHPKQQPAVAAEKYALHLHREAADRGRYALGATPTRFGRAFVYIVEAARSLSGSPEVAAELLKLALSEIETSTAEAAE